MSPRLTLAACLLVSTFVGCGGSQEASEHTTTEGTTPPAATRGGAYDLHEWGLLSVTRGSVELAAGPNARRMAPSMEELTVDKPVVYVHADAPTSFSLRVHLGAGYETAERWPQHAGALHWQVAATGSPCGADRSPYPTTCANTDGYCEALELPRYETPRASCLVVGPTRAPLLFYRLRADRSVASRLPVRLENAGFRATRPTVAYRVRWSGGEVRVARFVIGEAATRPPDATAQAFEINAWMRSEMTERGLDRDERAAFERAWWASLFGTVAWVATDSATVDGDDGLVDSPVSDEEVVDSLTADAPARPLAAPQYDDVLLYWLSDADIDDIARLDARPAPRSTRRAFLVRHAF